MSSDAYALNPDMLVGGQAVLEGVMMRSAKGWAVAVRRPDGSVAVDHDAVKAPARKFPLLKWPVFRGSVVLIQSLILGFRALSFAARQAQVEQAGAGDTTPAGAEPSRGSIALAMGAALLFAAGVFIFLPLAGANLIRHYLDPAMGTFAFNLADGAFRVVLFFGYLLAIARLPDIRRVFEYHGAEHKVVYTFEAGEELTVDNAMKKSRLHPRCGTSFLLFVLVLSIAIFAVIPASASFALKFGSRIFFIPLIAGLAYEIIRFSSNHMSNPLLRFFILPGLWLQHITTREPDASQVEVALTALKEALVFDLASAEPRAAVL